MSDTGVGRPRQPLSHRSRSEAETRPFRHHRAASLRPSSSLGGHPSDWLTDVRVTVAGLAISALIVVAMMIGSSLIVLAASAIVLVAAVVSPLTGLIALAFTAPLPRPLEIPAPGLYFAVAGAVLLGMVLRLPIERPRLRGPAPAVMMLGAFFVYVSTQFAAGLGDGTSVPRSAEIAYLYSNIATGVLAFTAASFVLRDRSPYPVVAALLLSALLASAIALAQSIGAEGLFGHLAGPSVSLDRMTGPFGDPNYFGAYLAVAITLAVGCAVTARSPWVRATVLGLAAVISAALLLTLSRGGLVALAAGMTTIAFSRGRRVGLATVAAVLLLAVVAYPMFAEVRYGASSGIAGRGLSAQIDESDRVGVWLPAIDVIESAPIFGVGYGRFVEAASSADSAHNWYLSILAEAGVAGFALWALFVAAVALSLRKKPQAARTIGYSVLVVWLASNMFLDTPNAYQATGPVLLVLAAALSADWMLDRRETTAPAGAVTAPESRTLMHRNRALPNYWS